MKEIIVISGKSGIDLLSEAIDEAYYKHKAQSGLKARSVKPHL